MLQVVFEDATELLLSSDQQQVWYKDAAGMQHMHPLQQTPQEAQLRKRICYARELLPQLVQRQ